MVSTKKIRSGAVSIPLHMRRSMGLRNGVSVRVELYDDGSICLSPMNPRCYICDGEDDVVVVNGSTICKSCTKKALEMEVINAE